MSRLNFWILNQPTKKKHFTSGIFQILNTSKQQRYVFICVVNNTLQM